MLYPKHRMMISQKTPNILCTPYFLRSSERAAGQAWGPVAIAYTLRGRFATHPPTGAFGRVLRKRLPLEANWLTHQRKLIYA
jgi:hypothetical protein